MNKKIKNLVLYGILMVIVFGSVFTPFIADEFLWKPENNKAIPFSGIHFDIPTNISNFKIRRSETQVLNDDLISYDIEFEYKGADSSMRIIGKIAEQAFFGDTVVPRHSKATLKGEYDKINNILFDEKFTFGDLYKKIVDYKFTSVSEIRVPLSESVKNYKFRLSYDPKILIYSEGKELAKTSVFLTNARVDNFTDGEYVNSSEILSFNESGMYINALEVYDEESITNISFWKNVNNVVFILSVIISLILIWLDRINSPYFLITTILVSILTFYRFFEFGVSTLATVTVFPILGILAVIIGRLTSREKIQFNKYDFAQGLLGAFTLFILSLILYIMPKLI